MTENKQPTQEQLQRFWIWCGLKEVHPSSMYNHTKYSLDGLPFDELPILDLNNIFKYAVPKIAFKEDLLIDWIESLYNVSKVNPDNQIEQDPALSLFWKFMEVIDGK
jgi:hypothetical protein